MEEQKESACDIEAYYRAYIEAAEMDDFLFGDISLEMYYQTLEVSKDDSHHGHICSQTEAS
jgi:hypothetical protein